MTKIVATCSQAFGERMLLHEYHGKHVYPPLSSEMRRMCAKLLQLAAPPGISDQAEAS